MWGGEDPTLGAINLIGERTHPASYTRTAPNNILGKGHGHSHGKQDRKSYIKADSSTDEYASID